MRVEWKGRIEGGEWRRKREGERNLWALTLFSINFPVIGRHLFFLWLKWMFLFYKCLLFHFFMSCGIVILGKFELQHAIIAWVTLRIQDLPVYLTPYSPLLILQASVDMNPIEAPDILILPNGVGHGIPGILSSSLREGTCEDGMNGGCHPGARCMQKTSTLVTIWLTLFAFSCLHL